MVTTIKQTNSGKKVFRCLTTLSLVCSPLIAEKPYFQQEVHYQIEVRLDPQRHFLYGKELLTYKNNSPDELPFVWFHLYPNAYKNNHTRFAKQHEQWGNSRFYFATQEERGWIDVKFFRMHGEALSWEYQEGEIDEAKVALTQPLKPGETVTFEIEFEVKIPVLFSRLGHLERNYSITHWYPKIAVYDRFGWHPDGYLDQGEFYGDFGSFTVSITVPTTFVLDATGTIRQPEAQEFLDSLAAETERIMKLDEKEQRKYLLNYRRDLERSDDELKTVTYYAEGVHDFAWFATERCMVQKGRYIYPSGREVDTYALFFPENFESWKHATEYIARTLELFGRWYGEYRYPKATAMDGSISGAPGAMEFPMITGIGSVELPFTRLLERTIVHEVGHNWFYGMLGSNERQDAWLDEGIVDFSTRRYMATRYPPRGLISTIGEATNGLLSEIDEQWWADQQLYLPHMTKTAQPIALRAEAFSLSNYRYMVYVKAPAMMYALKNYLGEHRFDKLMQTYFERWCFKHPTRGDFVAVCNEVAGEDISWFFEQWLDGTALPDFALGSVQVSRQNNRYHTEVEVKNREDLWMPVYVAAVTESGDTVVTKFDPRKTKSARFMTSSELKRIEVNPQREIAETDYLNNASFPKLQLRFLFDVPSFEQSQIVLGPKLWYEPYKDGWRIGMYAYTGNIITVQHNLRGSGSYSFRGKRWNYSFSYSHKPFEFLPGLYRGLGNDPKLELGTSDIEGRHWFGARVQLHWLPLWSVGSWDHMLTLRADRTKISDIAYYQPGNWQSGRFSTVSLQYMGRYQTMLYSTMTLVSWRSGQKIMDGEFAYDKIEFSTTHALRFSRNHVASMRFYVGVSSGSIPLQERIYLAGSLDPDFESSTVPYRRGVFSPLNNFWIEGGPGVRGYAGVFDGGYPAGTQGVGLNVEVRAPLVPLRFFYDAGAVWGNGGSFSLRSLKHDAGFVFRTGLVNLAFPFWISDPEAGKKPFAFRWLMSVSLPF